MAQLRQQKEALDRHNAQVLVISFTAGMWSRAWLQETQSPFPLLLDPERSVYRAYGLKSSLLRVWSPKVMWYYTRKFLETGRIQRIQGDPHQLGGDFIVDSRGLIRLVYRSHDPTDRPPVETILRVLEGITGQPAAPKKEAP